MNRATTILPTLLAMFLPIAQAQTADESALRITQEAEILCNVQSPNAVEDCLRQALTDDEWQLWQAKADEDEQLRAASDVFLAEIAEQLLLSETPRASLLAARLMRSFVDYRPEGPPQDDSAQSMRFRAGELARAAALRADDDPAVLWTLANGSFREAAPELAAPAITRLRELQPKNLAVWFLGGSEEPWTAERLQRAADATHLDWNYYGRVRDDVQLLQAYPVPAELKSGLMDGVVMSDRSFYAVVSIGFLMADAIPSLQGVANICTPGRAGWLQANRALCERIAHVLHTRSDTLMGTYLGNGMLQRLATEIAAREELLKMRRTLEYQQGISGRYSMAPEHWEETGERMLAPGATEMSVLRDVVKASGQPELPPANWRSSAERYADEQQAGTGPAEPAEKP